MSDKDFEDYLNREENKDYLNEEENTEYEDPFCPKSLLFEIIKEKLRSATELFKATTELLPQLSNTTLMRVSMEDYLKKLIKIIENSQEQLDLLIGEILIELEEEEDEEEEDNEDKNSRDN
jgi:hypothetical protein